MEMNSIWCYNYSGSWSYFSTLYRVSINCINVTETLERSDVWLIFWTNGVIVDSILMNKPVFVVLNHNGTPFISIFRKYNLLYVDTRHVYFCAMFAFAFFLLLFILLLINISILITCTLVFILNCLHMTK